MKRRSVLLDLFRRRQTSQPSVTTLDSAGTSTTASAKVADVSGWENSAAALRNLQKASEDLDEYFRSADNPDASLTNILLERSRWAEKAEACANSSFADCSLVEIPRELTARNRPLRLAALCAVKVYAKPGSEDLSSSEFDVVGETLKIDAGGLHNSVKATNTALYAPKTGGTSCGNVVVVAIRGTVNMRDWMVNLNDGADKSVQDTFLGKDEEGRLYSAHSGFLACAKAMNAAVLDHIYKLCANNADSAGAGLRPRPTLLFTGHSAGGAVAAMLYAHFTKCAVISEDRDKNLVLKNGRKILSSIADDRDVPLTPTIAFSSVNCITFGAPPITTRPLVPSREDSICLAIVNDKDPIPRADNKFIHALLRLFSGPMPATGTHYVLPRRVFFNAGQVHVALKDGTLVRPNDSGPGSLAETVMGDKKAHSMKEYRKRIEL